MSRERMDYDVVIVGAGPAGLSSAIRLMQLAQQKSSPLRVCILEKASMVGAQILSGAAFQPTALNELLPDWRERGAPLITPATEDHFIYLTEKSAWRLPTPRPLSNKGNYIISLENLCQWLGKQAEELGVEIYPGFAATEALYNEQGEVCGVATGDMGNDKSGNQTSRFQMGIELHAKQVLLAEGCRGSLSKQIIERFKLAEKSCPQTYGIGIKELWEVDPAQHFPGRVTHTFGWPLDTKTYGGSFIYHLENNRIAVGFVIGLDYKNPFLSPFEEFQRFKTHPSIYKTFQNGKRICYGARAISEGGYQSIPKLNFPGGLLIGDAAGFLNVPKIKGSHTAMKSGMVAAETIFPLLKNNQSPKEINYRAALEKTWLIKELYNVRNIRPAFQWGLWPALVYSAIDTYLLWGKAPWTLRYHQADYQTLELAKKAKRIDYPKPDNKITFDRLTSVYLSNINHDENQPCHLQLKNPELAITINYREYDSPEQRYCPAAVYEIVKDSQDQPQLRINAQNCIHCKTCDIKDPMQNINWVPPEGGSGPNYEGM